MTENTQNQVETQTGTDVPLKPENTWFNAKYTPAADVVEADGKLRIFMDMPGVKKENVNIRLEKDFLTVDGATDSGFYGGKKPLYSEYDTGRFARTFELSDRIDRSGIEAELDGGVLTLTLPKNPEQEPRSILIN